MAEAKKAKLTTQLDMLKEMTVVVADTGDFNLIPKYKPKDCTTNPSLVYKATQMDAYKHFLDEAVEYAKKKSSSKEEQLTVAIDYLFVSMGVEILKLIELEDALNDSLFATNFGGGAAGGPHADGTPKTKAEVMHEIIMKSRLGKYQRDEQKTAQQQLSSDLDAQFDRLAEQQKLVARKSASTSLRTDGEKIEGQSEPVPQKDAEVDDGVSPFQFATVDVGYDDLLQSLASDTRARPTDRLKTEAEKAEQLRDRLHALEEQRKLRMRTVDTTGENDDDDDNVDGADGVEKGDVGAGGGGDLLSDGFGVGNGGGDDLEDAWATVAVRAEAENATVDSHYDDQFQQNEQNGVVLGGAAEQPGQQKSVDSTSSSAVPYVVEQFPETVAQFDKLADGMSAADQGLLISRIRACFSPLLQPQNKQKMEKLFDILLEKYFVCARALGRSALQQLEPNEKTLDSSLRLLDILALAMAQLAQDHSYHATNSFRELLKREMIDAKDVGARDPGGVPSHSLKWPRLSHALLAKLVPVLFAVTDMRHPVVTPVALWLCQRLRHCPIGCRRDVLRGLFLCSVAVELAEPAQRYMPEVQAFLCGVLRAYSESVALEKSRTGTVNGAAAADASSSWAWTVAVPPSCLQSDPNQQSSSGSAEFPMTNDELLSVSMIAKLYSAPADGALAIPVQCLLAICVELLNRQWLIVRHSVAVSEVWPSALLSRAQQCMAADARLGKGKGASHQSPVVDSMAGLVQRSQDQVREVMNERAPLALYAAPPRALRQLDPMLNPASGGGTRTVKSAGAAALADGEASAASIRDELKRLKKRRRQEMRGAVRELRKDNYFVESLRRAEHTELVQEKAQKEKAIMTLLMNQQHEANQVDSLKQREQRKKKRANFNKA